MLARWIIYESFRAIDNFMSRSVEISSENPMLKQKGTTYSNRRFAHNCLLFTNRRFIFHQECTVHCGGWLSRDEDSLVYIDVGIIF